MTNEEGEVDGVPSLHRYIRPKLRQATVILPTTGERIKKAVTFRNPERSGGHGLDGTVDNIQNGHASHRKQSDASTIPSAKDQWRTAFYGAWTVANSRVGQGVLKCSLAYLLGSLATFVPPIAGFLGQQDGKHMVATITVYFHPARSAGSMVEAMLLASAAFTYATFICFTSMAVSILLGQQLDLLVVGHVVVLIVFCGGGLGFVGWVKQRLASPLVNVACSLASLAIITVLTKEGAVQAAHFSDDKVVQVLKMIIMGVIASTLICFIVSPISARRDLRAKMIDLTDAFGVMLTCTTQAFLTGDKKELENDAFRNASKEAKDAALYLPRMLKEAKYEHLILGTETVYDLESRMVDIVQRLAQNLGGLYSAAITQFGLLVQSVGHEHVSLSPRGVARTDSFASLTDRLASPKPNAQLRNGMLTAIDEQDENHGEAQTSIATHVSSSEGSSSQSPIDIFADFIDQLGPSMKSLAFTMRQILDELPYGPAPTFQITISSQLSNSLYEAMSLYRQAREVTLQKLYKQKEINKPKSIEVEADYEEVAASCGQFSFSLQDLGGEIAVFLETLEDLRIAMEVSHQRRSWAWLKFWRLISNRDYFSHDDRDHERESLLGETNTGHVSSNQADPLKQKSTSMADKQSTERQKLYWNYRLWRIFAPLRRDDIKFAIKVGIGAALYALPSFLASTRSFYQHWRGEWGLLSYMLVCSMTKGSSNTTGLARALGTCIGAACAVLAWIVAQENPFALAFFGWIMSLWTSYLIIGMGKGPMGRFIMLTYNLSALYAYSLSVKDLDNDDDEGGISPIITEIAIHRVVAVLSGCLWGLIVTRLIWPISAREKFKKGLSLLWLRMSLIWKRDPLTVLLDGQSTNEYMDIREESDLRSFLTKLESLVSSASSEVNIRGPFPQSTYQKLLSSTELMLNAFHTLNAVILKDPKASRGERAILEYTTGERAQLSSRISHLFQVLASSMKLEFPLDALPSILHSRDRLLAKLFQFRKGEQLASGAEEEDFSMLYAYALVTGQLAGELHAMGHEIENLFGVLTEDTLELE